MQRERRRTGYEILDRQDLVAARARTPRIQIVERASDHHPDDVAGARPRGDTLARVAAVAQDDETIRHLLHLFDEMRDVDDGVTLALQPVEQIEERSHVAVGEA